MRLAAVLLLFKEEAFVEACVRAIYPVVDSICVTTQYDRTYAGREAQPDGSLQALLRVPDPDNKIHLTANRDVSGQPGINTEARLRNAAIDFDPKADYYLIVDSDEIWPTEILRQAWALVQQSQWAGYKASSYTYFRQWNYRIVEPEPGYRPFVFLRRGFKFLDHRQIDWHGPARWREYLRKGRKPKTVYLPPELRLHHGSCVGDEARMQTKLKNYGHSDGVAPDWFDRVWRNFHPGIRNFHHFHDKGFLYESLTTIPTSELPEEITRCAWPDGWIDR